MYILLADSRDQLARALQSRGITVGVHYQPCTHFPIFQHTDLPNAEQFFSRALTLPLFPQMTDEQIEYVAHSIREGW